MSTKAKTLTINFQDLCLSHGTNTIKLTRKWIEFFALLGHEWHGDQGFVTDTQVHGLPAWRDQLPRLVGTQINTKREALERKGLVLLEVPLQGKTTNFKLNHATINNVTFDIELSEVSALLGLTQDLPIGLRHDNDEEDIARFELITFARNYFEQGLEDDCIRTCNTLIESNPTANQHMEALALKAWAKIYWHFDEAPAHLATMVEFESWCAKQREGKPQKERTYVTLSRHALALIPIMRGRYEMRAKNLVQARKSFLQAKKLLDLNSDHREWAAIEAGLGYISQNSGDQNTAIQHYMRAARHAHQANWPWSEHNQYCNLSCAHLQDYETYRDNGRHASAQKSLDSGLYWANKTQRFTPKFNYGGCVDDEVNLAFAFTSLGQIEAAKSMIEEAFRIAHEGKRDLDFAMCHAERAEWHVALAKLEPNKHKHWRALACQDWEQSIGYLTTVGVQAWLAQATKRLAELTTSIEGRPLKLW